MSRYFTEALFTDLYELTMAQAYHAEAMNEPAAFELYFRSLPEHRNFMVAAGLDDVLGYLEDLQFDQSDLDYLRTVGEFSDAFLQRLAEFRFRGQVEAVPEGTVVFPNEPLLRVVAPILDAQVVETFVINQVHFQTLAASKAARVVLAAHGRKVVDFGSRRAHGTDAALKVARAAWLVGAAGTSNVLAGKLYGIPIVGTMAHSYIQAHDDEAEAFRAFAELYPQTTLLVDTYDTLEGVRKVIDLCRRSDEDVRLRAVRLDSGDLAELARRTRAMLDEAGLGHIRIVASGGLDEYKVAALREAGAPIDAFGVGTKMVVAADAPHVDFAYKLVEYAGEPRTKLSTKKVLYPGRKQVFRRMAHGKFAGDTVGRDDESLDGQPLLEPVMRDGWRLPAGNISLADAREHAREQLDRLPEALRRLDEVAPGYPVSISPRLERELRKLS